MRIEVQDVAENYQNLQILQVLIILRSCDKSLKLAIFASFNNSSYFCSRNFNTFLL
jgi:hypothetical protein